MERPTHGLAVNDHVEGEEEEEDEDGRDAVTPNVNALVVQHEQTAYDFRRSIEVDAVAMGYVVVVLHKFRCGCVVSDEMPLLVGLAGILSFLLSFCVLLL